MACPEGDSFIVDSGVTYENSRSFNGCYEAIAESWGDETAYFLDGEEVAGTPGVYPSGNFDDEHDVWVLAYFTTDGEFSRRCKDAEEEDSSTVHPADVLQWDCMDADDTDVDLYPDVDAAVDITCGCDSPTPFPTTTQFNSSPTSSPTTPALGPASPSSPSSELTTETSSGKGTPVGAIAGGVVVGVLVVGSAILAGLFRTGRLKNCRGGSRNTPADDGVSPGSASDSVPNGGTSVEATTGPTRGNYPVAHQYPAAA